MEEHVKMRIIKVSWFIFVLAASPLNADVHQFCIHHIHEVNDKLPADLSGNTVLAPDWDRTISEENGTYATREPDVHTGTIATLTSILSRKAKDGVIGAIVITARAAVEEGVNQSVERMMGVLERAKWSQHGALKFDPEKSAEIKIAGPIKPGAIAIAKNNIVFVGQENKARVFQTLIMQKSFKQDKISNVIVVDDKQDNIAAWVTGFSKRPEKVYLFYYPKSDLTPAEIARGEKPDVACPN
jgi:hypothetical protein